MSDVMGATKPFYTLLVISVLAFLMVFGLLTKTVPLTVAHTIYYCQGALSNIVFTLPHSFPSIFVLVLSLVMLGVFSLLIFQVLKTTLFVRKMLKDKVRTPKKVRDIVLELGIQDKLAVVLSGKLSSFCYGYIKPRILLSTGLINSLNKGELKAVLLHESYHLKRSDPLKILLSQVAATMFFFVPILRDFHSHYVLSKEITADQLAIQDRGGQDIRSALMKMLNFPTPSFLGVTSFANENSLEERIEILTNPGEGLRIKISKIRLVLSTVVFLSALALLNLPVYAVENGHNSHAYFICPYGDQCTMACSQKQFTPANYSPNN